MPILSSNFNQIGNAGQQPGIVMIETDDSLSKIETTGYLNVLEHQGLPLSESLMALVSINKGSSKSSVWMTIHSSNENWSLIPITSGGSSILKQVATPMSASEFKSIVEVPKLILPAQGANTLIIAHTLQFEYHYGTTQYANGAEVYTSYGDLSTLSLNGIAAANFTFQTANTMITGPMYTQLHEYYFPTTAINSGIYLRADVTDFTDGDGTFIIHMSYEVITTSF